MGASVYPYLLCLTQLFHVRLAAKRLGLDAARKASQKRVKDIKFEPKGDTKLSEPKYGKDDPKNAPHSGGNTWAGGVSVHTSSTYIPQPPIIRLLFDIFLSFYRPVAAILQEWVAEEAICVYTRVMTLSRSRTL